MNVAAPSFPSGPRTLPRLQPSSLLSRRGGGGRIPGTSHYGNKDKQLPLVVPRAEGNGRPGLLRVPWTARRANQSILKEISSGCSLEGMMLKLKLQSLATSCEELTHWKRL